MLWLLMSQPSHGKETLAPLPKGSRKKSSNMLSYVCDMTALSNMHVIFSANQAATALVCLAARTA